MTKTIEMVEFEHAKEVSQYIEDHCPAYASALNTCRVILGQWKQDHAGTIKVFDMVLGEKIKQFQEGGESEINTEP
jgi:hypothetical protein